LGGWCTRAVRLLSTVLLVLATATLTAGGPPAAAQATNVLVQVLVPPQPIVAGGAATIDVRANGCSANGRAELYLMAQPVDTGGLSQLIAVSDTATTVLGRTVARLRLTDALAGWYGVRVVCGDSRPSRTGQPGTTFQVAPAENFRLTVPPEAKLAEPVPVSGSGCQGGHVQAGLVQDGSLNVRSDAQTSAAPDGTWALNLTRAGLRAGNTVVTARCVITLPGRRDVSVIYPPSAPFRLLAG
jgi:hypothetical protein